MRWINFLHFYQPPTIDQDTIRAATEKSYSFIFKILQENPRAKITANINASLLELWADGGFSDLLQQARELIKKGKIELALSAYSHPILRLLPFSEAKRQVEKSEVIRKKFFPHSKPRGFFFPEMVYDKRIAVYLKQKGYQWIILDELALEGKFGAVDYNQKYIDKNSGLQIVFRQRKNSQVYPPKVARELVSNQKSPEFLVTATDAELYGDRHIDYEGDFYYAVRNSRIICCPVSQYLRSLKKEKEVRPKIASWDTKEKEYKEGKALWLWQNPHNRIHQKLWELTKLAQRLIKTAPLNENYYWARQHLDKGMASCTYWWASEKDFRLWSLPAWHPDQIIAGAKNLTKSVRCLTHISAEEKIKAEDLFLAIQRLVWHKHWRKYYPLSK